jgi:hypothetical protein
MMAKDYRDEPRLSRTKLEFFEERFGMPADGQISAYEGALACFVFVEQLFDAR